MKNKYGRDLRKGDFIILASDHHLELGFFIDRNERDVVHYYTFYDLLLGDNLHNSHIKCYDEDCKIAKYSSTLLNEEHYSLYQRSVKILKQLKIRE